MKRTISIGPFGVYYSNSNPILGIPLHTHYAEVTLCYDTEGEVGFPVLDGTCNRISVLLSELTSQAFEGATNEAICQRVFEMFDGLTDGEIDRYGGQYKLTWVELAVRGVKDGIGHAEGVARYRVDRDD